MLDLDLSASHTAFVVDELLFELATPRSARFADLRHELMRIAHGGADLAPWAERMLAAAKGCADWRDGIDLVRAVAFHAWRMGDVALVRAGFALDEKLRLSFLRVDFREPIADAALRALLAEAATDTCSTAALAAVLTTCGHALRAEEQVTVEPQRPVAVEAKVVVADVAAILVEHAEWLVSLLRRKPEGRGLARLDVASSAAWLLRMLTTSPRRGASMRTTLVALSPSDKALGKLMTELGRLGGWEVGKS